MYLESGHFRSKATMAASDEKHNFMPTRNENILGDQTQHPGYPEDEIEHPGYAENEIERPVLAQHDSSTLDGSDKLERTQTTKSARERRAFQEVRHGDREELQRLASTFSGSNAMSRTNTGALERQDTLAGINVGDAVLDPGSDEFDVYKWARK